MRSSFFLAINLTLVCRVFSASIEDQLPERLIPEIASIMESALERSSTMRDRALAEAEAEGERIYRRASMLPQFSGSLFYQQEEDQQKDNGFGYEDRVIYSVNLTQPVFHWGARSSDRKIGRLQYDMEMMKSDGTIEAFRSGVRSRYMALVLARATHEVNQFELDITLAEYEREKEREKEGLVSSSRLIGLEIEIDNFEIKRLVSGSDWENKLNEFSLFTGLDRDELKSRIGVEIPKMELLSPDEIRNLQLFVDTSIETAEDIAIKDKSIEISRKVLAIERVSLRPKFDIQIGMTQNARDLSGVRREQEYVYAGMRVNWNIFDGFKTKGRKMEALARLQRNEESKKQLEERLRLEYSQSLVALEIAARTLSIRERQLLHREGSLSFAKEEFEAGRVSNVRVDEVKLEYDRTSIETQKARVAYLNALSKVSDLLG